MRRELTIERVVPGGDGLARDEGRVVLVPGGLPGDRVSVDVVPSGPSLARGGGLRVLAAGEHRRGEAQMCPRARDGSCGGCDWPAARLSSHEALKRQLVEDALRRVARLRTEELPPFSWRGSPRGYRLRSRLHLDGLRRLGFFAPRSNDASDLETCEIVSPSLLARLPRIREAFRSAEAPYGELTVLETRAGERVIGLFEPADEGAEGERLAEALAGPLDGVLVRSPSGRAAARGPSSLVLTAGGAAFRVSVTSFFQGNRFLLDELLDEVRQAIALGTSGRAGSALDLYAGAGFLTRALLETGAEVSAVEADASSSGDLAWNLAAWCKEGLSGAARAIRGTAEGFLARHGRRPDVVVADPPRPGLSKAARNELARLSPRALVLVSCDPATLARDLAGFLASYRIVRIALLDLFPQTHHVETVVTLARGA